MVISKAVCVVYPKSRSKYALDEKNLRSVLDVDGVRDCKVVVVSLVGASRLGKSVLANFFLRYLDNKYGYPKAEKSRDEMNWMKGDDLLPLVGFPWSVSAGTKPVTKGIWMSSTAYLTDQKVAIVILDTQGIYDSYTTNKDWTTILAFTSMVSSVTCYNVMNDIKQSELNSLLFFCQYGRFAMQSSDERSKPMQNLMFIIRDWQNSSNYGEKEGAKLLDHSLGVNYSFKSDLNAVFDKVSCFVLPFPGIAIEAQDYHGSINKLNDLYKTHLHELAKLLFDRENLVLKTFNNETVTAEQLIDSFKSYIVMLQRDELPEPKSLFLMSVEVHNRAAKTAAKSLYSAIMKTSIERSTEPLSENDLWKEHEKNKQLALAEFDRKPKLGSKTTSQPFRRELEDELDKLYRQLRLENKRKKNNAWRPYILGGTTLALAIALEIVFARWTWHRVALSPHAVLSNWAFLGFITWQYIRHRHLWIEDEVRF